MGSCFPIAMREQRAIRAPRVCRTRTRLHHVPNSMPAFRVFPVAPTDGFCHITACDATPSAAATGAGGGHLCFMFRCLQTTQLHLPQGKRRVRAYSGRLFFSRQLTRFFFFSVGSLVSTSQGGTAAERRGVGVGCVIGAHERCFCLFHIHTASIVCSA